MELRDGIYSRRSVRHFTSGAVPRDLILEIIRAGTWAPSGLNNQPWRFVVVTSPDVRERMSSFTKYSRIIRESSSCIAVFIDRAAMYHEVKDHQAVGACLQNMLLAAHDLGLGAVWLGEILKNGEKVRALLEVAPENELMAVVAVGHPDGRDRTSRRRELSEVLLKEI